VERGISTSLEILRNNLSESPDGETEATFGRLTEATSKMNAILTSVGNYSLSLPGARHLSGSVPMESILQSAMAGLDREIRESGATVTHGSLPEVMGDGERLRMLFRNLIENALKYRSEAPPQIEVTAKRGRDQGDQWIFSVKDNGIGIDPKYWHDLFIPFKRLHGSEIPGVGLGLVICRRILDMHQGRIWIESEPGNGATFLFTLPAESGSAA
jgi:two-component system, chemotaxis family, sensor kinase Cph1